MNWWSVTGLICDIVGVIGAGMESFIWTRGAPLEMFGTREPAMTQYGFGVPRPLYRLRHRIYWSLIVGGFALQLIGQFR